ncbi:rhomboid family intramembrane serine protease [Nocardioides sp. AE5]|uniref:rhomboid family intramembrane serine protease n=1 Tax=Nocardioides sp. AE5 TaxID=2962573 RepID=UPI00288211F1|nr:rhomboid family intramembrane serine protease [Nocardioides sp. AE5]MDT0202390.1 rhomboid family intramembrane serine protease [Nocardioides sp. AE5]
MSIGAKQTRQGRAAYGGKRPVNAMLTTYVLIGINLAVWLLITATGGSRSWWRLGLALIGKGFCVPNDSPAHILTQGQGGPPIDSAQVCSLIDQNSQSATWMPGIADGAWWQPLTSMFTHVDILHIAFNMLALFFLAPALEMALGRLRFLAVYLGSGLFGSAVVYWLSDPHGYTVGASGAVFGLMGALLVLGHKVGGNNQTLLAWIGINVVITLVNPQISWQGHLGGFIGGALLGALIIYAPKERRTAIQATGFGALMVVAAVIILLRTLALT